MVSPQRKDYLGVGIWDNFVGMMRFFLFWVSILICWTVSCKNDKQFSSSAGAPIPTVIDRFDSSFFALDTANLESGLNKLGKNYPDFFPSFLTAVLGLNPADPVSSEAIKTFIHSYEPVYQYANEVNKKPLEQLPEQVEEALQRLRHLSPAFKPDSPFVITTFIGPMDAFERFSVGDYGDVRTSNGVGLALQFHLGADASIYEEGMLNGVFFNYQVRRFSPNTLLVNAMKAVVDDYFPYTAAGRPLIEEMVEKGKRIFLLKKMMPAVNDTLLIGYTGQQLVGCFENEGVIWKFFVQNDLLYSQEASINQLYISDGPKTVELGEGAPGYIGLFTGWRIVEAYMEKNPGITIDALMQKPANEVFLGSGYKPK